MAKRVLLALAVVWLGLSAGVATHAAAPASDQTNLPATYRSLKSSKVFMRVGPGKIYPVIWVYQAPGLPLQLIATHNEWLQVRDVEGETGWIYHRLLSSVPTAMTTIDDVLLHHHPDDNATVSARLMRHVITLPQQCRDGWCRVDIPHGKDKVEGWVRQEYLWGATP